MQQLDKINVNILAANDGRQIKGFKLIESAAQFERLLVALVALWQSILRFGHRLDLGGSLRLSDWYDLGLDLTHGLLDGLDC